MWNRQLTPEGQILRNIREFLRVKGWRVIRIQQGPLCEKGISDLICVRKGEVVFIEVKTSKGKQSIHQQNFQNDIETHGGKYLIVRSIEDLVEKGY